VFVIRTDSGRPPAGNSICETLRSPVEAKLTIYPGVGHNAWDRTYDLSAGNDIYTWMLGFSKP